MPKLRVLIVDDEEQFRAPIRAVLASRGLEVIELEPQRRWMPY